MMKENDGANSLLHTALSVAMPIWQHKLSQRPWAEIQPKLAGIAETIASEGDLLFHCSKKPGGTARVFNATAEGIAALSFMPGGVTLFGQTWSAKHPDLTYPDTREEKSK